jgi:AraC-like DNA-binding protein
MDRFWKYRDVLFDSSSPLALTESFLNRDYPLHSHDFYEFTTILGGSGIHRINGLTHHLLPGMTFVIKPGDTHGYGETKSLRLINVIMYGQDMMNLLGDLKSMAGFQYLFVMEKGGDARKPVNYHQLSSTELAEAESLLGEMKEEYRNRAPGYQAKLKSILLDLIVRITRSYDGPDRLPDDSTARLGQALAYMEKDFYREITIPEIAEKANISLRQFQRIFSQLYGIPPIQYLLNLRIQAARTQLMNTDASIGEIADLCGFGDSNYFSRQFRKSTGLSPREFRRQRNKSNLPGPHFSLSEAGHRDTSGGILKP